VEDSEALRNLVLSLLRRQGYTVLFARDGEEALKVSEEHAGTIHLVVTDVVMPRMGGTEMARQLLRSRPATRVLYTSGYIDNATLDLEAELLKGAFLPKPFTPQDLARKVREILGAPL
jgi:CheY-like chemotaxis protein